MSAGSNEMTPFASAPTVYGRDGSYRMKRQKIAAWSVLTLSLLAAIAFFFTTNSESDSHFMLLPHLGDSREHLNLHLSCGDLSETAFADMHDGDIKIVTLEGTKVTVEPAAEGEDWVVEAALDPTSCTAPINFNVPGKPNPPSEVLLLTIWHMQRIHENEHKLTFEFKDSSGKLPLNHWVQLPDKLV